MASLEATKAEMKAELADIRAKRADIRAGRADFQVAANAELVATIEPLMREAHARDQAEKRIREAATILSANGLDAELKALVLAFPWVAETVSGFQRLGHVDGLLVLLNKSGFPRPAIVAAMVPSGALSPGQPAAQLTKLRVRLVEARRRMLGSMRLLTAMRPKVREPEVGAWIDLMATKVEYLRVAAELEQKRATQEAKAERFADAFLAWQNKPRLA